MQAQGQFITLRDHSGAKALIAPDLGGWLLRYSRHLPDFGYVDGLYYAEEVVNRYPNQMYAGNPLLFPQVSFSHLSGKEHQYEWGGKTCSLPQHGFARRSRWRVAGVTESSLLIELSDSDETRMLYPFQFRTAVKYNLDNGRLHLHQVVENCGPNAMPFSTGIHPYFPVPITPSGKRDECVLEVPSCDQVKPSCDWLSWSTETFPAQQFSVQEDVSGTMFLTNLERQEINLLDQTSSIRITLNFEGSPRHRYVALWSKSVAEPFYCVEPWTSLPNSLTRKGEDLIQLAPGEKFEARMWFDISRS